MVHVEIKDLHNSKVHTVRPVLPNFVGCFLEPENLIKIKLFSSFRGNNKLAKNSNIKPLDSKC